MKAQDYLRNYTDKISKIQSEFFAKYLGEVKKYPGFNISDIHLAHHLVNEFKKFSGGKNLRGALVILGYQLLNKKIDDAILKASLSVQINHSSLLMQDDFMDKDDLRRGNPSIHAVYDHFSKEKLQIEDNRHYGYAMAVCLSDWGLFMAMGILNEANMPLKYISNAFAIYTENMQKTALGQALDITLEGLSNVIEDQVLAVNTYKASYYTFVNPLQIGAALAGGEGELLENIKKYALPVGIAFQLRDDELGLFSDENKLGKPIGSDVRENKNTLLKVVAFRKGNTKQREILQNIYGKETISRSELEQVRSITMETGALEYSHKEKERLVKEGKEFIPLVTQDEEIRDTLYNIADFITERRC